MGTREELTEEYINSMREELKKALSNEMTGNIEFKVNFNNGGITNLVVGTNKSIKH